MLLYPGELGSSLIIVTPPSNASQGAYQFTELALNIQNTSYAANATATYNVMLCARANPSVSISPSSQTGSPGQAMNYTVTVTNNDNSVCPSSSFNITPAVPAGWSHTPASQAVTIAAGLAGSVGVAVASASNASAGPYQFTEQAANLGNSSYAGTGAAIYLVALPDLMPPVITISSPQNNPVIQGNNLQISSSASDPSGILLMQIWANGELRATCNLVNTCSASWNVHNLAPGTYPITVGATDNSPNQNYGNSTIFVIKQ